MKKAVSVLGVLLMAVTMSFTTISCKKKEEAPKKQAEQQQEQQPLTPEQKKQIEEMKKGVEASKKLVVARVNRGEITMLSLVQQMNALAARYLKPGEDPTPQQTEGIKKEALDRLIDEELAVQEAIRQGIKIKKETIDGVIERFKTIVGSEEAFKKDLKERSMTEKELRQSIERMQLFELITKKEIYDKIITDEALLKKEYENNKKMYMSNTTPPRQMTFQEANKLVERDYKSKEGQKRTKEWAAGLRKNAKIEITLEEAEKKLMQEPEKKK